MVDTAFSALIGALVGGPATAAVVVLLVLPLITGVVALNVSNHRLAALLTVISALLTLMAALTLLWYRPEPNIFLRVDDLNIAMIVLVAVVSFTSSVFSVDYIGHELKIGKINSHDCQWYYALYQWLMGALMLAMLANNVGLMWLGIEFATLMAVRMVGLYDTASALEAAWRYFILGSVGVALALFGIILVYFAAAGRVGAGWEAMAWTVLMTEGAGFDPALLNLAFVFLLLGFGTKAGLVPMHAWLPDAHAEGPTPITAVLSGLLINVSLYVILRFKMVMATNSLVMAPGPLMMLLGLLSVLFAAFMLYQRRDIKRLFAYSSIEHMGICTFAFGFGGPLANFAGLLHMGLHSLTKSAIFFAVGNIVQVKGSQEIAKIRGLSVTDPFLGWGLAFGVLAITGLPPFGVFMSEFLLISATFAQAPLPTLLLVGGVLLALGALLMRLNEMVFTGPDGTDEARSADPGAERPRLGTVVPLILHFILILIAGLWLPPSLVSWFQHVARLLG